MDASSGQWIAELGIMEPLSSESFSCTTDELFSENAIVGAPSSIPHFLSFANSNDSQPQVMNSEGLKIMKPKEEMDYDLIINHVANTDQISYGVVKERERSHKRVRLSMASSNNPNSLTQDHIMAERRRREKLSQRLIALSALIPGLKKMDKASVLGDAIRYMKHLQEQVKTLEEKVKQRHVDSAVLVKKYNLSMGDNHEDANSSSCNQENSNFVHPENDAILPEIEARVIDKDVLIRIHCQKQHELLGRILAEMENLHLSVIGSNSMVFGNYDMVVTITAQMQTNFSITAKYLVSELRKLFSTIAVHLHPRSSPQ